MIIDNFIDSFPALKSASLENEFKGEVNQIDGVIYPLISKDIPDEVRREIEQRLAISMGRPIKDPLMFMRMSPEGVECPHIAHNDSSMGDYSLMLYVTDTGGTALLRHKSSGIAYNPEGQEFIDLVVRDQNSPDLWESVDYITMKPNRGFIFEANRFHRADPIGGHGKGEKSRVVLTCFFK